MNMQLNTLDADIAAFEAEKSQLEAAHLGKWVVFHAAVRVGIYDDFDAAAKDAVTKFGRGPYLIRQIGEGQIVLPASVVYSTARHAN